MRPGRRARRTPGPRRAPVAEHRARGTGAGRIARPGYRACRRAAEGSTLLMDMRRSILRRLASWLAVAVALQVGFAPTRGLVVCFEPGGTIALEALDGSRTCPDRQADADHEAAPR